MKIVPCDNPLNPSIHLLGRVYIKRSENMRATDAGIAVNVNGFPEIELFNGERTFYAQASRLDGMNQAHSHLLHGEVYRDYIAKREVIKAKKAERDRYGKVLADQKG